MSPSGNHMVSAPVGEPMTSPAHRSLDFILTLATQNKVDPICMAFGPVQGAGQKPVFSALVAAQNASGDLLGLWTSEPVFGSSEAAYQHAIDLAGDDTCILFQ